MTTKLIKIAVALSCMLFTFNPISIGQAAAPSMVTNDDASLKVKQIMDDTLARGVTLLPDGIKATTWVPPTAHDIMAIKALGDYAIRPLGSYLNSEEPRAQLLAVRFLGVIGGEAIIPFIRTALEPNRWVVVRTQALSSLMSVPPTAAIPIIEHTLETDHEEPVQQRAKQLLTLLGGSSNSADN